MATPPAVTPFNSVVILGAGVMGARLAALCAGRGLAVTLLDQATTDGPRNALAARGLRSAQESRPAAFDLPSDASRVRIGNFEDGLDAVSSADWVVEAVVENLAAKQALLGRVAPLLSPHASLSTNTSGLPLHEIAAALPAEVQPRFFGTHFFNPPRYLRLVEMISAAQTDAARFHSTAEMLRRRLGKEVVFARDTPNFIANRIGTFALLTTLRLMESLELTVEEIDVLTGPLLGWPKSATLRTLDLVGLDTLAHVVRNSHALLVRDERRDLYQVPAVIEEMIGRGFTGEKSGQGFYRRERNARGETVVLALDLKTWTYRERQKPHLAPVEMAMTMRTPAERLPYLTRQTDAAGTFIWQAWRDLWLYAAARVPEIADDGAEIDRAMRWGYNWEWGPFELWDALGVAASAARMKAEGHALPPYAAQLVARPEPTFYRWQTEATAPPTAVQQIFAAPAFDYAPVRDLPGVIELEPLRRAQREVRRLPGCSLFDLGEGVGCWEIHSKLNTIGGDTIRMITETLHDDTLGFEAFVLGNESETFSAGADLLFLLLSIQNEEWDAVGEAVEAFQGMTSAIRHSPRPVIAAAAGLALGGGCELALHSAQVCAHSELYMGLVETGVGLIPAGGGCTQMARRASQTVAQSARDGREPLKLLEAYQAAFETIALGKVSTSAAQARQLGLLRAGDAIIASRSQLLRIARDQARQLADGAYIPPGQETISAPGPDAIATLRLGIYLMREAEYISDFDQRIGEHLLTILGGAGAPMGTPLSENDLLHLEREAFLSLCGEAKTQERIGYMLKTGRPLRN